MAMLTDLVQIDRLGRQKKAENARFRVYLKSHDYSDRRLRRLGEEIESQIDCTQCANCCRVAEAGVKDRDIEKLAKFIGVSHGRISARLYPTQCSGRIDPEAHPIRLRIPRRQPLRRLRGAPAKLREFSKPGARRRLHRQPHVAVRGSSRLLPDRLQLDGNHKARDGIPLRSDAGAFTE